MTATPSGRVFRSDAPLPAAPDLLRVATRGSRLAVSQTTTVAERIAASTGLDVAIVIVTTKGDTSRAPLSQLGGTGVFVSALREALLVGACDFAVHSLKDLPTGPCPGIAIGAIPPRADARDALCATPGLTLAALPAGARVGTGSPRRAAQVLAQRPDLEVVDLRGNIDTRLGRVGTDLDAVILAAAGLDRIDRGAAISERFPLTGTPTAAGQGALAVEVREGDLADPRIARALADLDDPDSRATATAERVMLGALEAGCAAPVGATARVAEGDLVLRATVYRLDGGDSMTAEAALPWPGTRTAPGRVGPGSADTGPDPDPGLDPDPAAPRPPASPSSAHPVPEELGRRVAADLLARGAAELAPLGGDR